MVQFACVIRDIVKRLPIVVGLVDADPDGNFPNGVPNPLLPDNRKSTIEAIQQTGADLGIAWDGDFDRCFFFDHEGTFIEGITWLVYSQNFLLDQYDGAKIIHDPRLTWNTIDIVTKSGGLPIQSKTGHAFIKERECVRKRAYMVGR